MTSNGPVILVSDAGIEFVIIGSKKGRDVILLQSDDMKPDLLAIAIRHKDGELHVHGPGDSNIYIGDLMVRVVGRVFGDLFGRKRVLNVVTSSQIVPESPSSERVSHMSLAWVGDSDSSRRSDIRRVKDALDCSAVELHNEIGTKNYERIAWNVSPVLYECMQASERAKSLSRFIGMYMLVVVLFGVVATVVSLVVYICQNILFRFK